MCDERLWHASWQLFHEDFHCNAKFIHLAIPVIEPMTNVIDSLAAQITAPNAILVGFSLGGYIAAELALRYPDKLTQLIIVSNLPQNLPELEIKQRKRTINWVRSRGYSGIPLKRIYDLLHPTIKESSNVNHSELVKLISAMDKSLGETVLLQQLSVSMNRQPLITKLGELAFPVMFLIGDSDSLVDLKRLQDGIKHAKNITLDIVGNTGHMLPLESPNTLCCFLEKCISN